MRRWLLPKVATPILLGFVFSATSVGAYSVDTHAHLTDVAFEFYNEHFSGQKIPENYRNFLIDGARREDDAPRWMNHFYDPVHNKGLTAEGASGWVASKIWAEAGNEQNEGKYKVSATIASILRAFEQKKISELTTESNFEWRQAIQYYLWGEKEKAMFVLGHILHLIEDTSVPDHTRNDPHPGDSPYEIWTENFTLTRPDENLSIRLEKKAPVVLTSLDIYFDSLAVYSNNNFYSADTIGIQSGFKNPEPVEYERNGDYFYAMNRVAGDAFPLFKKAVNSGFVQLYKDEIFFDDAEIMSAYWSRLSTKAVQHAAGVIDLFFKEVEKAKNDPSFSKTKPKSALAQAIDSVESTAGNMFFEIQSVASSLWTIGFQNPIKEFQEALSKLVVVGNPASPVFAVPFEQLKQNIEKLSLVVPDLTEAEIVTELNTILDAFETSSNLVKENTDYIDRDLVLSSNSTSTSTGIVLGATTESEIPPSSIPAPAIVYGGGGVFASSPASTPTVLEEESATSDIVPEPTSTPLKVFYSFSSVELVFDWSDIPAVEGTSTVEFELFENLEERASLYRGSERKFTMRITGVGVTRKFLLQQFVDGAEFDSPHEATINIPSFLSEAHFYTKASGTPSGHILEFAYPTYPFVPDLFWETKNSTYKLIFVYLNREPPAGDEFVNLMNGFNPTDKENLLTFNFKRCYNSHTPGDIVLFPDPGGVCGYGGPYTIAVSGDEREDNRVKFPIVSPLKEFSDDDYVTFAFYAFFDSGPASAFRRVAVDKTHYHFANTEPVRQKPNPISNMEFVLDSFRSVLNVSWPQGTDPDSRDETLTYEFAYSSTTGLLSDRWTAVGAWTRAAVIPVESGEIYSISVRVVDEDGNRSDLLTKEWRYPVEIVPLPHQRTYSNDIGGFGGAQKMVLSKDAKINGVLLRIGAILNYMTFSVTSVGIYSDRDGEPGDLLGTSEIIRKTWVTSGTEVAHMEDSEMIYEFVLPVELRAGEAYWIIPQANTGNQATLRVLGSTDNPYPDGEWSTDTSADAYFFLREAK